MTTMKLLIGFVFASFLLINGQQNCSQGVPALKRLLAQTTDASMKKPLGLDIVRCAMESGAVDVASVSSATAAQNRRMARMRWSEQRLNQ